MVGSARCADHARVQRASERVPEWTLAKDPSAPDTARGGIAARRPFPTSALGLNKLGLNRCEEMKNT